MLKLRYIGKMEGFPAVYDTRLWDVLEPKLPGYVFEDGRYNTPTLGLTGLQEMGLVPKKESTK